MVLKKSNSYLNSGATQRVRDRRKFLNFEKQTPTSQITDNYVTIMRDSEINTRLAYWQYDRQKCVDFESEERYLSAEHLMFDFLYREGEICGPGQHVFQPNKKMQWFLTPHLQTNSNFSREDRSLPGFLHLQTFSLYSANMWNLPDRLFGMMMDKEFIEEVSSFVDLRITTVQMKRHPRFQSKLLWKDQWSSFDKMQQNWRSDNSQLASTTSTNHNRNNNNTNKKTSEEMLKRRRAISHPRGIQRPAMWSRETPSKRDWHSKTETKRKRPSEILHVEIVKPLQIDSRDGNLDLRNAKQPYSAIKQRRTHIKYQSKRLIQKDIEEGLDLCVDDDISLNEHEIEELNEVNFDNLQDKPTTTFNIMDVCCKKKRRRDSRIKLKKSYKRFQDISSYPDRHIQYISKEEAFCFLPDLSEFSCRKNESKSDGDDESEKDFEIVPTSSDSNSKPLFEHIDFPNQYSDLKNLKFQDEVVQFRNDFLTIKLSICLDDLSDMILETGGSGMTTCHKSSFGNCIPACFDVELSDLIHLIGTHVDGDNWDVSLQYTHLKQQRLRQIFVTNLKNADLDVLKLNDLILVAKVSMEELSLQNKYNPQKAIHQSRSMNLKYHSEQTTDILGMSNKFRTCTVAQASSLLSDSCPLHHVDYKTYLLSISTENHLIEDAECEVCLEPFGTCKDTDSASALTLLPCHHTFCRSCWRSHAYNFIGIGRMQITCMMRGCSEYMNEAMISSILPFNLSCQHRQQSKERTVDLNQRSSWCPNEKCDKVVVLEDSPREGDLGLPVVCSCGSSWCFSCRASPHWPISCSLAKNYNVLRVKMLSFECLITGAAVIEVNYRLCPSCKYPIEKYLGCPHMVCVMCRYTFCWNCMAKHGDFECPENVFEYKTRILRNRLVAINHPIEHILRNCIRKNEKIIESLTPSKTVPYIASLGSFGLYRLGIQTFSKESIKTETAKEDVLKVVARAIRFLDKTCRFIEPCQVLVGIALSLRGRGYVKIAKNILLSLQFIVERVHARSMHKPFTRVLKSVDILNKLMDAGERNIITLEMMIPGLQRFTSAADTEWVATVDPEKFIIYE